MDKLKLDRRSFLRHAAGVVGAATQPVLWPEAGEAENGGADEKQSELRVEGIAYPRKFHGRQLKMISFPLGGVAAGSIGLGGRGQLCNWEIFNRPNKGFRPPYAFASIWAQAGSHAPVARVLESRILPPYEGQDGLGSENAPGLSRLDSAVFTGGYPFAHIEFEDKSLPVKVELEAFSPFIPHEPDDSGLPVAILRYRVTNPNRAATKVSIAFSIDNPVKTGDRSSDRRVNVYRSSSEAAGLYMSNPGLAADDPMAGSFVLATMTRDGARISHWEGWPKGRWWNAPLLFWDQFSKSGETGAQPEPHDSVGVLCLQATIAPGKSEDFPFLLGWHFPNRTPEWCGWSAPAGEEKAIIGNFYAARFKDSWEAVEYTARNIDSLEARTRKFADAFRDSSVPGEVKDAASANLPRWLQQLAFVLPMASFMALRAATTHADAASEIARMSGTMRRRPHFCFLRLHDHCAEARSAIRWTRPERFTSASCCPRGKRDQALLLRMVKWARLFMRGWTGSFPETTHGCEASGRG